MGVFELVEKACIVNGKASVDVNVTFDIESVRTIALKHDIFILSEGNIGVIFVNAHACPRQGAASCGCQQNQGEW